MIQDVSDRMFGAFVAAARTELERSDAPPNVPAGAAATPIEVLSLGSAVLGRAAARTAAKPVVWIGVIVLLLVLYWVLSR
jgi:hypothetical protein